VSNELVKPNGNGDSTKALRQYLDARLKSLATFAASRTKPETLIRLAVFEFSQNPGLRACSPETIYASLILAAQIGLEPSGIRGECYLVPFRGKCTLIPGWRGLVKLARQSKAVKSIYAHVAYERDDFKVYLGSDVRIVHEPYLGGDAGAIVAAYAVAKMDNGEIDVEVMTLAELEYLKSKSAGANNPSYRDWEDQMYRKAPLRRLAKRLPLGDDFFKASKVDELAEAGETERIGAFIDIDAAGDGGGEAQTIQESVGAKLAEKAAATREGR
jgi:recombination protein RecT